MHALIESGNDAFLIQRAISATEKNNWIKPQLFCVKSKNVPYCFRQSYKACTLGNTTADRGITKPVKMRLETSYFQYIRRHFWVGIDGYQQRVLSAHQQFCGKITPALKVPTRNCARRRVAQKVSFSFSLSFSTNILHIWVKKCLHINFLN